MVILAACDNAAQAKNEKPPAHAKTKQARERNTVLEKLAAFFALLESCGL